MTLTDTKPTVSDEVRSSFDLSRFADETSTAVVRRVAGLGDRNSPDDWPEAMLVTGKELHLIVSSELAEDDLLSRVRTLEEALAKYAQDKTCRGDLARITLGLPTVPEGGHQPVVLSGTDEIVKSAYQKGWLRQTIKMAADRLDSLGDIKDMSILKTFICETASNLRRGSDEAESAAVTEVERQMRARQALGGHDA